MTYTRALLAAAVLLLTICGACSTSGTSKELAALDRAYQAGILTKEEYQAKKSSLSQLAALDKAYQTGVLTKTEYDAKRAALLGSRAQAPLPQDSAINEAPASALTVQPAVNSAPAAPAPAVPTQEASSSPPANDGHTYRMKIAKAVDAQGFERPMTSAAMLVPVDWQSEGSTTWNIKDRGNTTQPSLRASGPDGRAFEISPAYNWSWADDSRTLQATAQQQAQFGSHPCDVLPPMSAADYIKRVLGKVRPNAQLAGIEPAPKLMKLLQDNARKTEQAAAQYKLQQRVRPDVARARLKYTLNGKPVEEWLIVATIITGTLGPSFNLQQGRMAQAYTYSCVASMIAERAPAGQLDFSGNFFDLLNSTYRVDPQWQARVTKGALQIQQTELKGVRDRSAIVAKNAEDISNIQREGYENRQKTMDHINNQFDQYIRGVETFRNPDTGETVDLDNRYGHAWVNNRGEYLLSDQEGFDPNRYTKYNEDWKALEPVKP